MRSKIPVCGYSSLKYVLESSKFLIKKYFLSKFKTSVGLHIFNSFDER